MTKLPSRRKKKPTLGQKIPLNQVFIPVAASPATEKAACAIVSQVLANFGAGYGAQRQSENPGAAPANGPIFATPADLAGFHFLLVDSVIRNFAAINWDINQPVRDQVLLAAFDHGVLARQQVVSDGTVTLKLVQILQTLAVVQQTRCPGKGAGGGMVCDF